MTVVYLSIILVVLLGAFGFSLASLDRENNFAKFLSGVIAFVTVIGTIFIACVKQGSATEERVATVSAEAYVFDNFDHLTGKKLQHAYTDDIAFVENFADGDCEILYYDDKYATQNCKDFDRDDSVVIFTRELSKESVFDSRQLCDYDPDGNIRKLSCESISGVASYDRFSSKSQQK